MNALLLIVPLAPLAVALLLAGAGRCFTRSAGPLCVAGSAVALVGLIVLGGRDVAMEATWFTVGRLRFTVGLELDALSRFMAWIVAVVSLAVNGYAVGQMERDPAKRWFFALMSFFAGSMLLLVLANSLVVLFAAWEAVGVASFLLIGFWHHKAEARRAAQKAFLMTRLGDVGLLLGWLMATLLAGSTRIGAVLEAVRAGAIPETALTVVALLLLCGVIGKSAQLPLTAWLPDAMVGPTPVSALIHSATMVAAGVYLLLRLYPVFEAAPGALTALMIVGGATALFAALVATTQRDLKRVLAWSTSSQLGEMVFALGLAGPLAAAFHLATHATFKSTLFLAAGAVDHAVGTRELDRLGGLARRMPWTAAVFVVAALALAGIPPLSGFWSEDKILEASVHHRAWLGGFLVLLIFLAGIYISRAATAVFTAWPKAPAPEGHPPGWAMAVGMTVLAVAAALVGWGLSGQIEKLLPWTPGAPLSLGWKMLPVLAAIGGIGVGYWRVKRVGPAPAIGSVFRFLEFGLNSITLMPARACFSVAKCVASVERALDRLAQSIAGVATASAAQGGRIEAGLDAWAKSAAGVATTSATQAQNVEAGLDGWAKNTAAATWWLAGATDRTEERGLANPTDALGNLCEQTGMQLRRLATGKLYLYTLGLFIWALAVGLIGLVWLNH